MPGLSNYTFAEAAWSQELACWVGSHVRAFKYFEGLPEIVVHDNTKAAKPCRYEPDLNPTYCEMAAHYGGAVVPARPRKPRDKAEVEHAVQVIQRWMVAALRKRKFFSLEEVNPAIAELLVALSASWFAALDKPALSPLPGERYEMGHWRKLKVELDYHIPVAGHSYSVPYQLMGQPMEVRLTAATVEIFPAGRAVTGPVWAWCAALTSTHCHGWKRHRHGRCLFDSGALVQWPSGWTRAPIPDRIKARNISLCQGTSYSILFLPSQVLSNSTERARFFSFL